MAKDRVTRTIDIAVDGRKAQQGAEVVERSLKRMKKALENMRAAGLAGTPAFKQLSQAIRDLSKDAANNHKELFKVRDVMNDLKGSTTRQLRTALREVKKEMDGLSESSGKLPELRKQMKLIQQQIDKNTGSLKKQEGGFVSLLKHGAQMVAMYMSLNTIKSVFQNIASGLFQFSDQLTDIRKVSGKSVDEVKEMSRALQQIDSRTSVEELNKYAYAGAKLGVATRAGVDGLVGFTKAANQLGTALHEDLGDDAIVQLSKMQEVMSDANAKGVEQGLLSIGSAIFKLSSTTTANGANIVQFSKRLVGLAKASNMTTPEILALGSAADSMMLMPEVASTAMSKFITSLQTNYNLIEKDLKMKQGSLKAILENPEKGVMGAMMTVLERMKEVGGMNALNFMFKDMGSDGARLKNVMVTMSQNVDMLRDHLKIANEEFQKGTAVTQEYIMQNETAAALMDRAANMWHKSFVNSEGVDIIKQLAQAWYDFTKSVTQSEGYIGSVKIMLNGLVSVLTTMLKLLPGLIAGLMFRGCAAAIMGVVNAIRALSVGLSILKSVNFWMLAITAAVNAAIWAYDKFTAATKKAHDADQWMKDGDRERLRYFNESTRSINSYAKAIYSATRGTKERATAISNFNKQFGSYMSKLLTEKDYNLAVAKACEEVNKQMRLRFMYQQKQKEYDAQVGSRDLAAMNLRDIYDKQSQRNNAYKGHNGDWLESVVNDLLNKGYGNAQTIWKVVAGKLGLTGSQAQSVINSKPNAGGTVTANGNRNNNDLAIGMDAYRYIKQVVSARKSEQTWSNRWKGVKLDDVSPDEQVQDVTVTNSARDKDAETAARLADEARNRELRDQLKQDQADAQAMVDNVRNFFERQVTEQMRIATSKGMSEAEQTIFIAPLNKRMNEAMEQLRYAISGQKNSWGTISQDLAKEILEKDDEAGYNYSRELMSTIQGSDVNALHTKMTGVAAALNRPMNAVVAQMFRKGTENDQANATADDKAMQARMAAELERNYTGKVQADYYDKFNTFGFAGLSSESDFDARKQAIQDMFETARKELVSLIAIGEDDPSGVFRILFGDDATEWISDSPISDILKLTGDDFKLFYDTLIQYSDAYTQAEKKSAEDIKTLNDFSWKRTSDYSDNMMEQENVSTEKDYDSLLATGGKSVWQQMGLQGSLEDDPEIRLYKLKMEYAQKYYEFIFSQKHTQEQLNDADRARISAQNDYIKAQLEGVDRQIAAMQQWTKPIEDFGWSMGKAFATMTENAEEGRKAMKAALKDMVSSWAKTALDIVRQNLTTQVQMGSHYAVLESMQQAHNVTRETMNQTSNTVIETQDSAHNATELASYGGYTMSEFALSQARAIAKCYAQLGPIGGSIAAAAVMAVLSALISFAMSKAFGSSSTSSAKTNTKLVSGMLTYDSGNVQSYAGTDGHTYSATQVSSLSTGLVTSPIATTVNGVPSLVGEKGPEIVVGRETTAAIQRNDPGLLRMLVGYDKLYSGRRLRTYDEGNISDSLSLGEGSGEVANSDMSSLMSAILYRLENPIAPEISMYGRNGLHDKLQRANSFMRNKS